MDIVIIGTGNVATVLARKLAWAGHSIVQVFGRTPVMAAALAAELGAVPCSSWAALKKNAECYLVAIADNAIESITEYLELGDRLVAHTSGGQSKKLLRGASSHYGVFYPLQSLRKELNYIPPMPVLVDASDRDALQRLKSLAATISDNVSEAGDEERLLLHLAAVLVNNFTNYLYGEAEHFCIQRHLDFRKLHPLILETANRVQHYSPESVQTGPAIRNDTVTLRKHLDLLENDPHLKTLYEMLTRSIRQLYK